MKVKRHIKGFNEHQENLNISDVSSSFTNNESINLRNGVGERVMDYCKLIDSGDLETAKEYLKLWLDWSTKNPEVGKNAKRNLIFTLEFYKRSKNIIDTTKKLLDEI